MRTFYFALACILLIHLCGCHKNDVIQTPTVPAAPGDSTSAVSDSKPNIIIVLADDIGYEIPTYSGGESYSTPNMDFMAANGTQFTQAHTAPLCSPSRFMLLTAKYNFRNYRTWGTMDLSNKTIANLAKEQGYATCMAGKWQFDGGEASIHAFGFDKYRVTDPFNTDVTDNGGALRFYKNPQIYENGAFLPESATKGKYGDDLIRDYMFDFIDSAKDKKPFFIYWATDLVHAPFSPTPDDPEFASWNPSKPRKLDDSTFFPSMVKYFDKLMGQLLQKLQADNLADNTIILFSGDNGTVSQIHSRWKGQQVGGDKSSSTEAGTHVPLLAYCPGKVRSGAIDTNLVSFVDFMPTVADLMKTTVPDSYGTIDGISFNKQLSGDYTKVRDWVFCHFTGSGANENDPQKLRRWIQDDTYKQYDSLPNVKYSRTMYNIKLDPLQRRPILPTKMTDEEKALSRKYLITMRKLN